MEKNPLDFGRNKSYSVGAGCFEGNDPTQVKDSFSTYTPEQNQSLAEVIVEIQQLLEQLDESYSTDTTAERMAVVTEAIKRIESNPVLMNKIRFYRTFYANLPCQVKN